MYEPLQCMNRTPANSPPVAQAVDTIRLPPLIDPQRNSEVCRNLIGSHARRIDATPLEIIEKLAGMRTYVPDILSTHTTLNQVRLEAGQLRINRRP